MAKSNYKLNVAIMAKYGFQYKTKGLGKGSFMRNHEGINYFVDLTENLLSIHKVKEPYSKHILRSFKIYNDLELEFVLNRSLSIEFKIPVDSTFEIGYKII